MGVDIRFDFSSDKKLFCMAGLKRLIPVSIKNILKRQIDDLLWALKEPSSQKVFCIGKNKTGTTSLEYVLKELGFKLGDLPSAEALFEAYAKQNWKPIIAFCGTAQAFQDVPFSWPDTWKELVRVYPDAKFILTYRDEEAWYRSLTSFHSKHFADGKRIPTKQDLQNATYRYKGFAWEVNRMLYNTPEEDPYHRETLIKHYNDYNNEILAFFRNNSNFIAIDVSMPDSYQRLCRFLNKEPVRADFPHLKKTNTSSL